MTGAISSNGGVQKLVWQQTNADDSGHEAELSRGIWLIIERFAPGKWELQLRHHVGGDFHTQTIHAQAATTAKKLAARKAAEWFNKHAVRLRGSRP